MITITIKECLNRSYDEGITSDFVLESCSVPVNYDYTKLNVQDYKLVSNEIL